jgi:hypothetical protein
MRKKYLVALTLCLTISVISTIVVFRNHNTKQNIPQQKNINVSKDKAENNKTSAVQQNSTPTSSNASIETKANSNSLIPTISSINYKNQNTMGNIQANIANGGYMASQDNWIYYSTSFTMNKNGIYKAMPDGITGLQKISNNSANSLNVVGSWVYYVQNRGEGIWKVQTNGKNEQLIVNGLARNLIVVGDYMYFINIDNTNKSAIYKMKTDGSEEMKITDALFFTLSDDAKWLYFIKNAEESATNPSLYKIKNDGSDMTKLGDNIISTLIFDENNLYFLQLKSNTVTNTASEEFKNSVLVRINSLNKREVLANAFNCPYIHNGNMYFCLSNNQNLTKGFLYKTATSKISNLDKNKIKLNNKIIDNLNNIYFLNNKIYAISSSPENSFSLYCIDEAEKNETFTTIFK